MALNSSTRQLLDLSLVGLVALLFLFVISDLVTKGMTLDGTLYAAIARDMAAGQGTFWYPTSLVAGHSFHDHPPLGLYLQSLLFSAIGDHFWTENLYSAITLVLSLVLVCGCLRVISQIEEKSKGKNEGDSENPAFYGILMFLISPLAAWTYTNNYLENTLTVFMLAAVLSCLLSLSRPRHSLIYAALSGGFVFLGVLTKGPVALWPLAFYPLYFFTFRIEGAKLSLAFVSQLSVLVSFMAAVWFLTAGGAALETYLNAQLGGTFSGQRIAQHGRFHVLEVLTKNVAGPLVYTGVLLAVFRSAPEINRWVILFLALALAATLPLMISPRQYEHYLLPGLPLFAMVFALATRSLSSKFLNWLQSRRWLLYVATILLFSVTIASYVEKYGDVSDDADHLEFVEMVTPYLKPGATYELCEGFHQDRIRAYLFRYLSVQTTYESASYQLCLRDSAFQQGENVVSHSEFRLNKLN